MRLRKVKNAKERLIDNHYFIEDASLQHNVVEKEVVIKTLMYLHNYVLKLQLYIIRIKKKLEMLFVQQQII